MDTDSIEIEVEKNNDEKNNEEKIVF